MIHLRSHDPQVRQQRNALRPHSESQFLLLYFTGECHATSSENALVAFLASAWALMLMGALRFAHLQRSTLTSVGVDSVHAKAYAGKRRLLERRAPFVWLAPRQDIRHENLVSPRVALRGVPNG